MVAPPSGQEARQEALRAQLLGQALEDALSGAADAQALQPLRQTAQVAAALERLQLGSGSTSTSSSHGTPPLSSSTQAGAETAAAAAAPSVAAEADADGAALFAGAAGGRLGVAPADLLAEALPSEAARRQALAAALPALEAELQRRCRLVAAASGYGTDDHTGLPDHMAQLLAARSQASQVDTWRKVAQQAQQAVALLARAAALLAGMLEQHKLTGQREADEARAAFLRCECGWLKEKIRLVQLQLQEATYSRATLGALRQLAAEVEGAVADVTARLQQASMQLRQYRALGPAFRAQAQEHAGVLQALDETEYELREIEQFRQLAHVTS